MPLDGEHGRRHLPAEEAEYDEDNETINNEDPRKRRRVEPSRFQPGSIVRIALKHFVTYAAAEFYPGPNMNLVIGPNGSGKSTLVCAICLGLGYPPSVLGRATAVGDFVQHGKDFAEIEVELASEDDKTITIKRRMKRESNSSTYFINGAYCGNILSFLHYLKTQTC